MNAGEAKVVEVGAVSGVTTEGAVCFHCGNLQPLDGFYGASGEYHCRDCFPTLRDCFPNLDAAIERAFGDEPA